MSAPPLEGTVVLDASRMIPGAVTARLLADLGARVIKVEAPGVGDPMRLLRPWVDGTGAAFAAFYRGAESVCLDLRREQDAERLRALAGRADVLLESFRPGKLASWSLGPEVLTASCPRLVVCSLSSFGQRGPRAGAVAHDLNLVASSGLLSLLPGRGVPQVQLADVTAGLLAGAAVLAALLRRARDGRGEWIDQPLSTGTLPLMAMVAAEASAGGGGSSGVLLGGKCAAYRLYTCGDGTRLAVATLEPKFWKSLVELLGCAEHAGAGLVPGEAGERAAEAVQHALGARAWDDWRPLFEEAGLPVSAVTERREIAAEADVRWLPSLTTDRGGAVPRLGEHTAAVLEELDRD